MWVIVVLGIILVVYLWLQRVYSFWSRNGIPGPIPMPFVENFGKSVLGKVHTSDIVNEAYRKYDEYPFFGVYRNTTPVLVAREPEFVKAILVKNFTSFHDNDVDVDKDVDPIIGRNVFVLKGNEWRAKRQLLKVCFTPAKIKGMFPLLEESAKNIVKYVEEECKRSNCLEVRKVCIQLTLNNVASCAFGLSEVPPDFKELADRFISPDGFTKYVWLLFYLWPSLIRKFKLKLIPKDVEERLFELVTTTMKVRKEKNIVRHDFLDIVNSLPTEDGTFEEIDIVSHAASFFGDGYVTSSRVMSFLLFELASNTDAQEKLRNEINNALEKTSGQFTFELIHDNKYLNACWNEGLRKNSVVYTLLKRCTQDFSYTSTNPDFKPLSVNMKAGDHLQIPITALHMDPKYFEHPDQFIPERFLDGTPINQYAFLPFGEGPRICLGLRFAQIQINVAVAYLVKHFKMTVNSKTDLPLKYDPRFFMRHVTGGLWVNFEKIEENKKIV